MTAIEQAREVLKNLPPDATMEQIQYHLFVAEKIRNRLASVGQIAPIPHDEVKKRLEKWLMK
jgi:hypothetical protein